MNNTLYTAKNATGYYNHAKTRIDIEKHTANNCNLVTDRLGVSKNLTQWYIIAFLLIAYLTPRIVRFCRIKATLSYAGQSQI